MKFIYRSLALVLVVIVLFSCKKSKEDMTLEEKIESQTPVEKKQINSVMTKIMVTPELKTFSSAVVTSGLTNILKDESGPFTVLAPSTGAFSSIGRQASDVLFSQEATESLKKLLNSHIVKGELDTVLLVQKIKGNDGSLTLETMSGEVLTASLNDTDIVIEDSKGVKALIGKSDIKGSNGVVHVLNKVLALN